MHAIIVIPTREEQARIEAGQVPDVANMYLREFGTTIELEAYIDGLEGLPDMMEYEIVENEALRLRVDFDGDVSCFEFGSPAEKYAYISGLEDADGFESPAFLREGEEHFDTLKDLMDARRAELSQPTSPAAA